MRIRANRQETKGPGTKPFFSPRKSGGFFGVQTKLTTGNRGDQYEVEADHIATQVVDRPQKQNSATLPQIQHHAPQGLHKKPLSEGVTPFVQGQGTQEENKLELSGEPSQSNEKEKKDIAAGMGSEDDKKKKKVQAKMEEGGQTKDKKEEDLAPASGGAVAVTNVESKIGSSSGGQKMAPSVQAEMETGFGADFRHVNVHTNAEAVQMNRQLGAQAFTHKNDIYFNKEKYNPGTRSGKHLLAHELTHTIQQTGTVPAKVQFTLGDGHDLTSARFSGNLVLEGCLDNEQTLRTGARGAAVTLIQQALVDAGFPLPQFGVDGIFGTETKSALESFQRASSLSADGIVGPATMSALDALFTGGAPALPPAVSPVPAPTTPPTVTSETILQAPNGSANTRTTVGVGERVRFTASASGTWTVSAGHIIGHNTGSNIVWEAPAVAGSPTITVTTPGGTKVTPFTVVAPNALNMVVARHDAIPVGTAGACMITNVTVRPTNVNLGRTQWLEVPGPATNISGYFARFPANSIRHKPTDHYLPFNDQNTGLTDHAYLHRAPPPVSAGTFEWVIPNRYKVDGETDAQGRLFTNTVQAFTLFANGTTVITKDGALVLRTTGNIVV